MGSNFVKDAGANLDYQVDWSSWLSQGETISTSAWTVGTGITKGTTSNTTTTATVWLSGGTPLTTYTATNAITTSQGRTNEQSIQVFVENL